MKPTQEAYSEFLQSREWDFFATVTSRSPRKDNLAFIRDFRQIAHNGFPWEYRGFVAVEPHRSGMIHIHSLLYYEQPYTPGGVPWYHPDASSLQSKFNFVFGRSRVDNINSRLDVSNYCSKYILKTDRGFEYDFIGEGW
jgi:hypothetical protein